MLKRRTDARVYPRMDAEIVSVNYQPSRQQFRAPFSNEFALSP